MLMRKMVSKGLAALLGSMAVATPAQAEWLRAESPNFIVYSESSEGRIREQVAQLEGYDRLLRMVTSIEEEPTVNKLHVYFLRGNNRRIAPVNQQVAGFYRASSEGMIAVVDETINRGTDDNDVLFHEYAHHFMRQHAATVYPAWYVEGFAEYLSTAEIAPRRFTVGGYSENRAGWLASRSDWIPFETVIRGIPATADPELVARFYAQSWLLAHFVSSSAERRQAFRTYITALGQRQESVPAFQAAFGMDMRALDRALRTYANGFTVRTIEMREGEPEPPIQITRLTGTTDALMIAEAALRTGVDGEAQRTALLAELRRLAARGDNAQARRLLAHAEVLYGDAAAAEPVLDALIAQSPQDAGLLYLRGMRHLRAGREDTERRETEFRRAPRMVRPRAPRRRQPLSHPDALRGKFHGGAALHLRKHAEHPSPRPPAGPAGRRDPAERGGDADHARPA
jgi:Arc/MetJ family transcription regulator